MELSTAESALRTLKHRPKVPHGAVETSAGLLDLLAESNPESTSGRPALEQQELLERGLTTLLLYGKERWEPIAVVCAVGDGFSPRTPTTPHRLDDVSGWKALESSLAAIKYIMKGSGATFLEQQDTMSGDKNAPFTYLTPEIWELITIKSVFHINRHVRVVGLDAITVLCELAPVGFLDSRRDLSDVLCKCIVRGMQDNWAQVRYAASHTTREFLLKLEPIAREDYFPMLVPRICLNRYYIAERVQKLSQETWRQLMGDRGREVVARYATEIVDYYIEMTSHCVREAACHCIAELATKVDAAAVRPHVPRLLDALLYSFRDSSWLCFLSEAKLMAAMRHDRIITFVGVGWDDPMDVHVVTEYMDGGDLRALLQWLKAENRPTGFDLEKLKIALHIIEALANVLLSSALDAKLIDFGVSRERVDYTMTEGVGTLDTHLLPYERPGMDPLPNPAVITQVTINRLQVTFTEDESHPMVVLARDCMAFEANERPKTSLVLKRMRAIFAKANGEDSDAFDE
ncbi:hypothetical protein ATCC90586_006784 [Pythium insidiosum]|nr:hypothetical protein ATCC90586_006784 [Pythium insidiosum]